MNHVVAPGVPTAGHGSAVQSICCRLVVTFDEVIVRPNAVMKIFSVVAARWDRCLDEPTRQSNVIQDQCAIRPVPWMFLIGHRSSAGKQNCAGLRCGIRLTENIE